MEDATTEDAEMLNANRNVIAEETPRPSPSSSSFSTSSRGAAPPVVVATFDWRKWLPWILLAVVLLLWLATSRRSSGGGGAA